jgi:hypothetical protein
MPRVLRTALAGKDLLDISATLLRKVTVLGSEPISGPDHQPRRALCRASGNRRPDLGETVRRLSSGIMSSAISRLPTGLKSCASSMEAVTCHPLGGSAIENDLVSLTLDP